MVRKQKKVRLVERDLLGRRLQGIVATTNKYFIVLLRGARYTRSSYFTISQVDAV